MFKERRAGPPLLRLMYIAETLINPLFTDVAFPFIETVRGTDRVTMNLGGSCPQTFWTMFTWHVLPCSHGRWHLQMEHRIVFTNSGFWKYSGAHLSEGLKTTASNKALQPCPLRTEIPPVSLNLLMMLCTVYDEICKAFAI